MTGWRPRAALATLRRRAELLATTRAFFARRGVLEVETPALSAAAVPDLHLESFRVAGRTGGDLYLHTSPEYAMKRLLAAGSGPIYQIARVYRAGEAGRLHHPEFTLLEWYRPGFDHHALMDEVDALLSTLLGTPAGERVTYAEAFARHAGVDPHRAAAGELRAAAARAGIGEVPGLALGDREGWLSLLLSHLVEPHLGRSRPTYLHDFPAGQAALARLRRGEVTVAERFELYVDGIELANGFHELSDPAEQRQRFSADLAARQARGLPAVPLDERFLAALETGLPDSAGVALGFDRLVMLAVGADSLDQVVAFPVEPPAAP